MQFFTNVKSGWKLTLNAIGIALNNKKLLIYGALILSSWLIILGFSITSLTFFYQNLFSSISEMERIQTIERLTASNLPFIIPTIIIFLCLLIYNFFFSSLVRSIVSIEEKPVAILESMKQTVSMIPALILFTIIQSAAIMLSIIYAGTIAIAGVAVTIIMFLTLIIMTLAISNPFIAIGKAVKCALKNIGHIAGINAAIGVMAIASSLIFVIVSALLLSSMLKVSTFLTIAIAIFICGAFLTTFTIITTALTISYATIYLNQKQKDLQISQNNLEQSF